MKNLHDTEKDRTPDPGVPSQRSIQLSYYATEILFSTMPYKYLMKF